MTDSVTVSIGMPVFNMEDHVGEAIESLLEQSYSNFELIVSDNASTDSTLEIVDGYAHRDPRIRVLRQQVNMGAFPNFDVTVNEARGEWFMWAAGDDVWSRDWLQDLVASVAERNVAAFGTIQVVGATGDPISHPANERSFDFSGGRIRRRLKYFMEPGILGKANPIYGLFPTKLMRRIPLGCVSAIQFGADMVYLYDLLAHVEILSVDGPILKKRVLESGGGQVMQKRSSSKIRRLCRRIQNLFRGTLVLPCMKRSNLPEALLILCATPVLFVCNIYSLIQYKLLQRRPIR